MLETEQADVLERDYLYRLFLGTRVLHDEVEDVFRHITMNLSPKTTCLLATVKEYR